MVPGVSRRYRFVGCGVGGPVAGCERSAGRHRPHRAIAFRLRRRERRRKRAERSAGVRPRRRAPAAHRTVAAACRAPLAALTEALMIETKEYVRRRKQLMRMAGRDAI